MSDIPILSYTLPGSNPVLHQNYSGGFTLFTVNIAHFHLYKIRIPFNCGTATAGYIYLFTTINGITYRTENMATSPDDQWFELDFGSSGLELENTSFALNIWGATTSPPANWVTLWEEASYTYPVIIKDENNNPVGINITNSIGITCKAEFIGKKYASQWYMDSDGYPVTIPCAANCHPFEGFDNPYGILDVWKLDNNNEGYPWTFGWDAPVGDTNWYIKLSDGSIVPLKWYIKLSNGSIVPLLMNNIKR